MPLPHGRRPKFVIRLSKGLPLLSLLFFYVCYTASEKAELSQELNSSCANSSYGARSFGGVLSFTGAIISVLLVYRKGVVFNDDVRAIMSTVILGMLFFVENFLLN